MRLHEPRQNVLGGARLRRHNDADRPVGIRLGLREHGAAQQKQRGYDRKPHTPFIPA